MKALIVVAVFCLTATAQRALEAVVTEAEVLRDKAVPERERFISPSGKVYIYDKGKAPAKISDVVTDTAGDTIATYTEKDMTLDTLPATVDVPNPSKRLTGFVKGDTVTIAVYNGDSLVYKRQRPITCDPPGENDAWALRVADMLSPDRIAPMDTGEVEP